MPLRVAVLLALGAGCSSRTFRVTDLQRPPPESALVHIYRASPHQGAGRVSVFMEGQPIGVLSRKQCMSVRVPSREVELQASLDTWDESWPTRFGPDYTTTTSFDSGKVYFMKVGVEQVGETRMWSYIFVGLIPLPVPVTQPILEPRFWRVAPERASAEAAGCKLLATAEILEAHDAG